MAEKSDEDQLVRLLTDPLTGGVNIRALAQVLLAPGRAQTFDAPPGVANAAPDSEAEGRVNAAVDALNVAVALAEAEGSSPSVSMSRETGGLLFTVILWDRRETR